MSGPPEKAALRKAWRAAYPKGEDRLRSSHSICRFLAESPVFRSAPRVALFHPLPWEPDITSLWSLRPEACVFPRVDGDALKFHRVGTLADLRPGYAGILEPAEGEPQVKDWGLSDLILVPGYAFDRQGGRIGSGKGFYDRFLEGLSSPRWAVCYGAQVQAKALAQIPTDVRMVALCTESGIQRIE